MRLQTQLIKNKIEMKQKIITPEIKKCFCGSKAKVQTWDIYGENIYRVICEKSHTLTKYCGTRHRAICRWNNRVEKHSKIKDDLGKEHEVVSQCSCGKPLIACLNSKGERIGVKHATCDDEDWHLDYWSTDKVLERQRLN